MSAAEAIRWRAARAGTEAQASGEVSPLKVLFLAQVSLFIISVNTTLAMAKRGERGGGSTQGEEGTNDN